MTIDIEALRLTDADLERIGFKGRFADVQKVADCPQHDWEEINSEYIEDGLRFVDNACMLCGATETICLGDDESDPDTEEPELEPDWDLEPENNAWDYAWKLMGL